MTEPNRDAQKEFAGEQALLLSRKLDDKFNGWEVRDGLKYDPLAEAIDQILTEWNSRDARILAKVKESVGQRIIKSYEVDGAFCREYIQDALREILAEINRLDKEET